MLISNDKMRDHIFQMLAPKYFHKWKQRHQVQPKALTSICMVKLRLSLWSNFDVKWPIELLRLFIVADACKAMHSDQVS